MAYFVDWVINLDRWPCSFTVVFTHASFYVVQRTKYTSQCVTGSQFELDCLLGYFWKSCFSRTTECIIPLRFSPISDIV